MKGDVHKAADIEEIGKITESNWPYDAQRDLLYFLVSSGLDRDRIQFIEGRIQALTDELMGTEQEFLLKDFYGELLEVHGVIELQQAQNEMNREETHINQAALLAAKHHLMQNLWLCFVHCRQKYISARGRLQCLSEKYAGMYQQLTKQVIGQDYAVNEFVQACFNAELYEHEHDPHRPQAVFLFAGPPGVGKTLLAQTAAECLGRPFKVFDMSAYSLERSDLALIGSETYFRHAGEGALVGFVDEHPDAVLLFDEIEKAHSDITRLFLSVLEGARLENKFLAANTDFSHTIIIFTTNAGRAIYEDKQKNLSATPVEVILKELGREKSSEQGLPKFPPELCSRLASQHIVMFNHIGIRDMVLLIRQHMDAACKEIERTLQLDVQYDARLALLLLMHFGNTDVRVITGQARQFIKKEIYELSRQLSGMKDMPKIRKLCFSIDDHRITEKARRFFTAAESEEVLAAVVCDEEMKCKLTSAHMERIRFLFIESEEKLLECDPEEVSFYLIDPYFRMRRMDHRILGLDDYDSVGLRIIKRLLQKGVSVPVYILEGRHKVSQTDRNTLYMRGVEDTIRLDDCNAWETIRGLVSGCILQKNCMALLDRKKVFDFESLQEMPDADGIVHIRFYDIAMKDAVHPEDRSLLLDIEERPDVTFEDVIGAENAKAELRDFIDYLENSKAYLRHMMTAPKGVLLYGPPGTGKTMLARALAGETDAAFISISAAKLRSSGEQQIEQLFRTARRYAPAIIFLDEVDAIARKRTGGALTSYEDSLLDMLLTQMDGFEQHKDKPVFIVAATNFSIEDTEGSMGGGLDPAFLRRFGNRILVDLPNQEEKIQFLSGCLLGGERSAPSNQVSVDGIRNIAERTPGESLAILENILEFAFRNAARKNRMLDDELLEEAMEEYFYGAKHIQNEAQVYRTAIHEAAHAYMYVLSGKQPVYLTVISRGNFGGYMQREDEEHKANVSREECLWEIRTCLAGRVGEQVIFGDEAALNSGAGSDLKQAGQIALQMLTSYGMYDGHLFSMPYEDLRQSPLLPSYMEKAEGILQQQMEICMRLVMQGKDRIISLAKVLSEKNHLNRQEIMKLLKGD